LGFGITIDIEVLKWEGQKPISKHILAMSMIFDKQTKSLMIILRWCNESLSDLGMEELLQLQIAFLNSAFEKRIQASNFLSWSLSSKLKSTCLSWALLKVEWSVFQRLSVSRHSWLLNLIASTAGSLCLLTQFSWLCSWMLSSSQSFLYSCTFWGCCYNLHSTNFWNAWWYW